ncbi:MAG: hypothetical protein ABR587_14490 [Candidatus Binatia bacterium]
MDPVTFRRDRYLRTSGYHLATWSLVALVVELRLGHPAPAAAVLAGLLAGATLTSFTHERRVGKMAGAAGAAVYEGAGRMWLALFAVLGAATAALVLASRQEWLFGAWAAGVGLGFTFWGWKAGFAWYVGVGSTMLAASLADAAQVWAGEPVLGFRVFVLGVALPALALLTNRRFLWFR